MTKPHSLLLLLPILIILLHSAATTTPQQQQHISAVDLRALRDIKTTLYGPDFFSTWDFSSLDPCSTFTGVTCSPGSDRVNSLSFGIRLAGTLSGISSLSSLTELTQFILSPGSITGSIPPQLGSLTQLRVISLSKNNFTGSVPISIFFLPNLHTLDLSYNSLTGSVPPGLKSMNRLRVLVLASNRFNRHIPRYFPAQLLHLDLSKNRFTGQLPYKMPLSLRYLSVGGNEMVGPINGLVSLSELVYLDLSMNKFSGTIPGPLFRPSISSILMQRNNFTGTLPVDIPYPSYYSPPSLRGPGSIVDLSHNYLSGQLLPFLADVENVFLNNNRLSGTVPIEYVDSVVTGKTRTLFLQHNFLSGISIRKSGLQLPDSTSVCLSFNCMVPPEGMTDCPGSAGGQVSRPVDQCLVFNNGSYIIG